MSFTIVRCMEQSCTLEQIVSLIYAAWSYPATLKQIVSLIYATWSYPATLKQIVSLMYAAWSYPATLKQIVSLLYAAWSYPATLKQIVSLLYAAWSYYLEVHYTKIKGEYVVTAPYPELKLIEENNEGFLLYEGDGSLKKLKIYDREGTSSYIEIDLSVE